MKLQNFHGSALRETFRRQNPQLQVVIKWYSREIISLALYLSGNYKNFNRTRVKLFSNITCDLLINNTNSENATVKSNINVLMTFH